MLDAGLTVYAYQGEESDPFEKMKSGAVQSNVVSSRNGKAKKADVDEAFWTILGGAGDQVKPSVVHPEEGDVVQDDCELWRLSDASGKLEFTKEATGDLNTDMLDTNDVFIVDAVVALFIWIGKGAIKKESASAMTNAVAYLAEKGRPPHTPITRVKEGQVNFMFHGVFKFEGNAINKERSFGLK